MRTPNKAALAGVFVVAVFLILVPVVDVTKPEVIVVGVQAAQNPQPIGFNCDLSGVPCTREPVSFVSYRSITDSYLGFGGYILQGAYHIGF